MTDLVERLIQASRKALVAMESREKQIGLVNPAASELRECLSALTESGKGVRFADAAFAATGRGPLTDAEIEVEMSRTFTRTEAKEVEQND